MTESYANRERDRKRIGAALFSLCSAIVLAAAKFVFGIISGSLGVLSSAFDSLADVFMSAVNFLSIRKSAEPPDKSHPYGHGKVETLATLFQGLVIAGTGIWVVYEGIQRLIRKRVPESAEAGILVMAAALAASWIISRRIRKAGEETGSTALVADSLHFATDVYTNGGILASLVVFRFTGWTWLDPGVALIVGAYILYAAGGLLVSAVHDLMDKGLPEETVELVRRIINEHRPLLVDFHDLRTRRAGSEKHVDFHVVVCREYKLDDAHKVADHLEKEVRLALGNVHVVTHVDPCDIECPGMERCERVLTRIRDLKDPADEKRAGVSGTVL
ncbi:MAG: cation transporter [Deltaproteobacteria bacterium]|nr:cation transporter [Deltaproteobacteria bacterium]